MPCSSRSVALLGYSCEGLYFVETRLPFGSRSSPFIFNTFADLLLWILIYVCGIPFIIHYLDDFFLFNTSTDKCKADMDSMQSSFSLLGILLATDKTVGPSQCLTYLGIEIDSHSQTIRLPEEKFQDLSVKFRMWSSRKKCTKRELLSLIGSLSFAAKVVKPGRMFLRCLIDLSTTVSSLNHHITLNAEARADINWWVEFLPYRIFNASIHQPIHILHHWRKKFGRSCLRCSAFSSSCIVCIYI